MTDPVWHVPFAGRNASVAFTQNFLVQFDNVYIMDNHRTAYWCWAQQVDLNSEFNMLHVDRHYDTLPMPDAWPAAVPDLTALSISDYLAMDAPVAAGTRTFPLFSWDNYLWLFLCKHADTMNEFWCATHGDGTEPHVARTSELHPWELPNYVRYLAETDPAPWICNIDLDYFFFSEENKVVGRLSADEYLASIFESVHELRCAGVIAVVTLCLSPECSGGWHSAEALAEQVCTYLEIPFALPVDD